MLVVEMRRTTPARWPFIGARRGRAGRPAWRRAAPPAAFLPPHQCLLCRLAGAQALVGGDGTRAEERRWSAMMRLAGLPSPLPVKGVGLIALLLMHSKSSVPCCLLAK